MKDLWFRFPHNASHWESESCTLYTTPLVIYLCIAIAIFGSAMFWALLAIALQRLRKPRCHLGSIAGHAFLGLLFCSCTLARRDFNQAWQDSDPWAFWTLWGLYNTVLLIHCLVWTETLSNVSSWPTPSSCFLGNDKLRHAALVIAGIETIALFLVYLLIPWAPNGPTNAEPYWTQLEFTPVHTRKDFYWSLACFLNIVLSLTFLAFPIHRHFSLWRLVRGSRKGLDSLKISQIDDGTMSHVARQRGSTLVTLPEGHAANESSFSSTRPRGSSFSSWVRNPPMERRMVRTFEHKQRDGGMIGIVIGSLSVILWILMSHESILGARAYIAATQMSLGWFFQFTVIHSYFPRKRFHKLVVDLWSQDASTPNDELNKGIAPIGVTRHVPLWSNNETSALRVSHPTHVPVPPSTFEDELRKIQGPSVDLSEFENDGKSEQLPPDI